jgi:hypothetical protein
MKVRRVVEKSLMCLGIDLFSIGKPDRHVLARVILPAIARNPAYGRVLFVGCDYYTKPYIRLFSSRELWTIEVDPRRARYGAPRHIVGPVQDLGSHFRPGYFDVIVCNGVIGFGVNTREAASEVFAACYGGLRSGGMFVLGWSDCDQWVSYRVHDCVEASGMTPCVFEPLGESVHQTATPYRHIYSFWQRQ